MPVEPVPTPWDFGPVSRWDPDDDLVGIGADYEPGTVLAAYRRGLFPMPAGGPGDPPYWFSPVRRGVLPLAGLRVSRSLRRSCGRFEIRVDSAFDAVVEACADPRRPGAWIDEDIRTAYRRLYQLGWAHSVEAWRGGALAGGLYGLSLGGLFAGESMFFRERDASKAALVGLVGLMRDEYAEQRLVDVQWRTPHLATLGVVELSRAEYLARLPALLGVRQPRAFGSMPLSSGTDAPATTLDPRPRGDHP